MADEAAGTPQVTGLSEEDRVAVETFYRAFPGTEITGTHAGEWFGRLNQVGAWPAKQHEIAR